MASYLEELEIDFLLLADHAELHNGKLYMMGGGYDRRTIDNLAAQFTINIIVGLLVPWNMTNRPINLNVKIETDDGTAVGPEMRGTLNMGRPAIAVEGQSFRAMIVVSGILQLPKHGAYRVLASLSDGPTRTTIFYAVPSGRPVQNLA